MLDSVTIFLFYFFFNVFFQLKILTFVMVSKCARVTHDYLLVNFKTANLFSLNTSLYCSETVNHEAMVLKSMDFFWTLIWLNFFFVINNITWFTCDKPGKMVLCFHYTGLFCSSGHTLKDTVESYTCRKRPNWPIFSKLTPHHDNFTSFRCATWSANWKI